MFLEYLEMKYKSYKMHSPWFKGLPKVLDTQVFIKVQGTLHHRQHQVRSVQFDHCQARIHQAAQEN